MLGKWPNPSKLSKMPAWGKRTLDQESPGSSPGGAMKPGNDLGRGRASPVYGTVRVAV
jgi:hypothetical protein